MNDFDFQKLIQPLPRTAKFSLPDFYVWCGSLLIGDGGDCHLFYSRWPRALGHNAWVTHSEIAHAVADKPFGPFYHQDIALPVRGTEYWDGLCTHNPTVQRFGGKYYLYYMGNTGDGLQMQTLNWTHRNNQRIGVAVADSPYGPWTRSNEPLITPTAGFYDALCCTNPSVTPRPDGGYLMIYKGVGDTDPLPFGGPVLHIAALSDSPTGPFVKQTDPVFAKDDVAFVAEDPFVWTSGDTYWAVVKDNAGHFTGRGKSLALFQSADGLHWTLAKNPLVSTTEVRWEDGARQALYSLERPQIFLEDGEPVALLCAADEDAERSTSYNLQIPLKSLRGYSVARCRTIPTAVSSDLYL